MSQLRIPISLSFPEGLSDQIDGVLSGCILDFKAMLFNDAVTTVGDCLRMSACGTEHSLVAVELDGRAFDLKLRAALRARGLELSDRNLTHTESSVDRGGVSSVADADRADNGLAEQGAV